MKNILNESSMMKWKNSDIYNRLKSEFLTDSFLVNKSLINKYFGNIALNEFYISKNLFTNKNLAEVLNFLKIRSINQGSYMIINEYNKSLPVKWDNSEQKYFIKDGYELNPVTGISWYGAEFIAGLFDARLPSEKEWEIAAKGGNKEYTYPWGNEEPNQKFANYGENVGRTSNISSYPSNDFGLYDMAGNVEEWCKDAPILSNGVLSKYEKIVKGGCWYKPGNNLICESKRTRWAYMSATGIGFRIVWDKDEVNG